MTAVRHELANDVVVLALDATQSHLAATDATFSVSGYELTEFASVSDDTRQTWQGGNLRLHLPRHALAVAVFKRSDAP